MGRRTKCWAITRFAFTLLGHNTFSFHFVGSQHIYSIRKNSLRPFTLPIHDPSLSYSKLNNFWTVGRISLLFFLKSHIFSCRIRLWKRFQQLTWKTWWRYFPLIILRASHAISHDKIFCSKNPFRRWLPTMLFTRSYG